MIEHDFMANVLKQSKCSVASSFSHHQKYHILLELIDFVRMYFKRADCRHIFPDCAIQAQILDSSQNKIVLQ